MRQIFHIVFSIILYIAFIKSSYAQISVGGEPLSFRNKNINQNIPVFSMPDINVNKLISEDIYNDNNKNIPWRFGENINVKIDVINQGIKDILSGGTKIWRLRIYSQGAFTLNFRFSDYKIPVGGNLYFYNPETKYVLGAFTAFNNRTDQVFATTLIEGESVIIEYNETAKTDIVPKLVIDRITHGYRNAFEYAKSFGSSGNCNVNITCSEGYDLHNQIRSVCMIVVNNSGFCTGSLINNTANNGTPYILTAKHCSTSNNFNSWVFWFNWQSTTCTNPASSPQHQSISGCELKARNEASDFCLVKMGNKPPADYNAYYSGWNHSATISSKAACIHHPNGDIKKISLANDTIKPEFYSNISCWKANWTTGVTEPGSSGSPLFDSEYRIIGQLYGGPSSCNETQTNKNDFFGRFSYSWDSCGTTPETRLKNWLDSANTGVTSLNGYDPVTLANDAQISKIISPENFYCSEQTITPKVIIKNNDILNLTYISIMYNIDNGNYISKDWTGVLQIGGSDTVELSNFTINTRGNYTFKVFVSNPNHFKDTHNYNDTAIKIFNIKGLQLPFEESFNNNEFPPTGWNINNPDHSFTWEQSNNSSDTTSYSAFLNLYDYGLQNHTDEFITPLIDLSSKAELTFYHAYRMRDSLSKDTLKIFVSTDCGVSFNSLPIYCKTSNDLATGLQQSLAFTPSLTEDWRKTIIPLDNFSGNKVLLKFVCISNNGNNLYLDNIRVDISKIDNNNAEIFIYPNPNKGIINLLYQEKNFILLEIFDILGRKELYFNKPSSLYTYNICNLKNGIYFIKLTGYDKTYLEKIILIK